MQIAAETFSQGGAAQLAVAVSGGSDSMAMLHLMARAARAAGQGLRAVTVDHRLRPEAAEEARLVGRICAALDVGHDTLVWHHDEIAGNLQDQARRARYGLIAGWARAQGIGHVAIAHTADDQAETFLMGLARTAGLDGLSGMRRRWQAQGVLWSRPFLGRTRADLRDYLIRHALPWVDDPSNADDRYTRIKARRALKALKPLGLTVERLGDVVRNLNAAREAVVHATHAAVERAARTQAGMVVLDHDALCALPAETRRRVMLAALAWISGSEHPPRESALSNLLDAVASGRDATLSGCRIRTGPAGIRLMREPRAVAGLCAPTDRPWDGRWHLSGPHDPALEIRALGAEGVRACKDWRQTGLPREALLVTPAVWQGSRLIAAPLAGKAGGWSAKLGQSFAEFILSH